MTNDPQEVAVQARRLQKLYASVVLAAIDDAIRDEQSSGNGVESIVRWATSRDGRDVLMKAGIEPSTRTAEGLRKFVSQGKPTSSGLARRGKARMLAEVA